MKDYEHSARRSAAYPLAEICEKVGYTGKDNLWKLCVRSLEPPKDKTKYDYQSRILFQLQASGTDRSVIANNVIQQLQKHSDIFEAVESSGKGFLNLRLTHKHIIRELNRLLESDALPIPGPAEIEGDKPKHYNIEFVSANPTGPLHVGHGRWAIIGDTLARLLRAAHHEVTTEFYVNNVGNQIELLESSLLAVQDGNPVPEGGYGGPYIQDMAKKLKRGDSIVQYILNDQKRTLELLKVDFSRFFLEEELHTSGQVEKTIQHFRDRGCAYEKEGALWFRSTDFGDDKDRVLKRADGRVTYFAADVAYHEQKFSRGYDRLMNIWGADHHGYQARIRGSLRALGLPDDKLDIKIGQLVSLTRKGEPVRMSKRTGDIVTIDEVREEVGLDAVRFLLLQTRPESHIKFDLELAKEHSENNPIYYVQYAHARCASILREAKSRLGTLPDPKIPEDWEFGPDEREFLQELLDYPDRIYSAAVSEEPHRLYEYAILWTRFFHSWYHKCRVLVDDKKTREARLAVVQLARRTLVRMLELMQVTAPEEM